MSRIPIIEPLNTLSKPKEFIDHKNEKWFFSRSFIDDSCNSNIPRHVFKRLKDTSGILLSSFEWEKNFSRETIEPKAIDDLITQGRWECAPACLAMLLNIKLWDVKRVLVSLGWNNDDKGTSIDLLMKATQILVNKNLIFDDNLENKECIVSVPSLNLDGKFHGIYWNGKEILDPNFKNITRKHYSPEWDIQCLYKKSKVLIIEDK